MFLFKNFFYHPLKDDRENEYSDSDSRSKSTSTSNLNLESNKSVSQKNENNDINIPIKSESLSSIISNDGNNVLKDSNFIHVNEDDAQDIHKTNNDYKLQDKNERKYSLKSKLLFFIKIVIICIEMIILTQYIIYISNNKWAKYFKLFKEGSNDLKEHDWMIINTNHTTEFKELNAMSENLENLENLESLKDFMPLYENRTNGPITIDRSMNDGTKLDIYSMINSKKKNYTYYDFKQYKTINKKYSKKSIYLCELSDDSPLEGDDGYTLKCPIHYTISVNYTFYGRYANDLKRCNKDKDGKDLDIHYLNVTSNCGYKYTNSVKKICEGKRKCILKPSDNIYMNDCDQINKYLHIKYQCVKEKNYRKSPGFAVVMFANNIKVNSVYENSVSEFYQYCKIYGYHFYLFRKRYDYTRNIYYVKLNSLLETMIRALKENKYEWIFWVDSDTILANPNIELETFIPKDDNIHFICSDDGNGLNAGVFLLRVHPWSLNLLIRSLSFSYYNNEKLMSFWDQSSLNNVLTESQEDKHYTIVPQNWFNSYLDNKKIGDFIIHLAGKPKKDEDAKEFRSEVKNQRWYEFKTNEEMRSEVLEYYKLPKEEQHKIKYQKRNIKIENNNMYY